MNASKGTPRHPTHFRGAKAKAMKARIQQLLRDQKEKKPPQPDTGSDAVPDD